MVPALLPSPASQLPPLRPPGTARNDCKGPRHQQLDTVPKRPPLPTHQLVREARIAQHRRETSRFGRDRCSRACALRGIDWLAVQRAQPRQRGNDTGPVTGQLPHRVALQRQDLRQQSGGGIPRAPRARWRWDGVGGFMAGATSGHWEGTTGSPVAMLQPAVNACASTPAAASATLFSFLPIKKHPLGSAPPGGGSPRAAQGHRGKRFGCLPVTARAACGTAGCH
jgi:hypothetical protein